MLSQSSKVPTLRTWPVTLLLALSLMVGLAPTTGWAQASANASITGTVSDESGGVLPGVTVTATSPALQLPQVSAVTDATGDYQLRGLPAPGVYHLTYE